MTKLLTNKAYKTWLIDLKSKIQQSQIKAALAVNSQLIQLYWDLGGQIVEKQETAKWGSGFIDQLSKDLKEEFPSMGGFSKFNLYYIRNFYLFYSQEVAKVEQAALLLETSATAEKVEQVALLSKDSNTKQSVSQIEFRPQVVPKLETDNLEIPKREQLVPKILATLFQAPWGHHLLILKKIKNQPEAIFYVKETIENNWSRAVLEMQIETNLYGRQGKAVTNFKNTLPEIDSDLANALLKDPYNFDFLNLSKSVKERDLETQLVANITQFLLELGKGFAYLGRQFSLIVGSKEFKTDLLFYHTKLKRYIVIELKVTEFEPEFLGKLNFYLTAIDRLVKSDDDKPTIGILLCKSKENVVVDFTLQDINKPLGVSEFTYTELPENIREALPTVEQLTEQLNK
jgi:predicted nuclease of restriction endonuclease-like (RecB) superfamily